jgi:hypothetical protein
VSTRSTFVTSHGVGERSGCSGPKTRVSERCIAAPGGGRGLGASIRSGAGHESICKAGRRCVGERRSRCGTRRDARRLGRDALARKRRGTQSGTQSDPWAGKRHGPPARRERLSALGEHPRWKRGCSESTPGGLERHRFRAAFLPTLLPARAQRIRAASRLTKFDLNYAHIAILLGPELHSS